MASMVTIAPAISSIFKSFGDGGDLVGLLVHGDLAQQEVVGRGPGVDQVQRRLALGPVEGAPEGLAVDGDDLPLGRLVQRLDPAEEAPLELVGVEPREEAAEGVVRGDAVGQGQEGLQPVVLGLAEVLDVVPGVGPGDDGADGDGHDVEQFVEPGAVDAGVGQFGEVVGGRFPFGGHGGPPWCLGVEQEDYQKFEPRTTFRRPIKVPSWCSDPGPHGSPQAIRISAFSRRPDLRLPAPRRLVDLLPRRRPARSAARSPRPARRPSRSPPRSTPS